MCLRRPSGGAYAAGAKGPATREGVKLPLAPRYARFWMIGDVF